MNNTQSYSASGEPIYDITFKRIIINTHSSNVSDSRKNHMESRVTFGLLGSEYTCSIWQAHGGSFIDDPIEVEVPKELEGKVHYEDFRSSMEGYYRYGLKKLISNMKGINAFKATNSVIEFPGVDRIRLAGNPDELGWKME